MPTLFLQPVTNIWILVFAFLKHDAQISFFGILYPIFSIEENNFLGVSCNLYVYGSPFLLLVHEIDNMTDGQTDWHCELYVGCCY
jgi:hypothetical protein